MYVLHSVFIYLMCLFNTDVHGLAGRLVWTGKARPATGGGDVGRPPWGTKEGYWAVRDGQS
jgi:hypothetical protein